MSLSLLHTWFFATLAMVMAVYTAHTRLLWQRLRYLMASGYAPTRRHAMRL